MRISDWSSDVCSSDLSVKSLYDCAGRNCSGGDALCTQPDGAVASGACLVSASGARYGAQGRRAIPSSHRRHRWRTQPDRICRGLSGKERKSDVEGKSVSVSVSRGGRRMIKKKKKINKQ